MRTIETLARQYPDKTGRELLAMQEQDKLDDQKEWEELNAAKIRFVESVKQNPYFKGRFGLCQHYYYKVHDIEMCEDGVLIGTIEKITVFIGADGGTMPKGDMSVERELRKNVLLDNYGLQSVERTTEADWLEFVSFLETVEAFFQWEDLDKSE